MSVRDDNHKMELRNVYKHRTDKRRRPKPYRCKCGVLVCRNTASMDEQQAGQCADCYRASVVRGLKHESA